MGCKLRLLQRSIQRSHEIPERLEQRIGYLSLDSGAPVNRISHFQFGTPVEKGFCLDPRKEELSTDSNSVRVGSQIEAIRHGPVWERRGGVHPEETAWRTLDRQVGSDPILENHLGSVVPPNGTIGVLIQNSESMDLEPVAEQSARPFDARAGDEVLLGRACHIPKLCR